MAREEHNETFGVTQREQDGMDEEKVDNKTAEEDNKEEEGNVK